MKHTEYIVPIGEEATDYDEMFIGVIRRQPELVRCKDCKFWVKNPYGGTAGLCNKHMLGTLIASFETDWCSWAERAEE